MTKMVQYIADTRYELDIQFDYASTLLKHLVISSKEHANTIPDMHLDHCWPCAWNKFASRTCCHLHQTDLEISWFHYYRIQILIPILQNSNLVNYGGKLGLTFGLWSGEDSGRQSERRRRPAGSVADCRWELYTLGLGLYRGLGRLWIFRGYEELLSLWARHRHAFG
jgi:hypothetical protein